MKELLAIGKLLLSLPVQVRQAIADLIQEIVKGNENEAKRIAAEAVRRQLFDLAEKKRYG